MGVVLYNDIMFLVIESCKVEDTVYLIKKSDANAVICSNFAFLSLLGSMTEYYSN